MDEEEINPIEEVEAALKLLTDTILGEPSILIGWTLVVEAADGDMNRMLMPISKSDQPSWVTKSMHQEAVDGIRNQELLNDWAGDALAGGDEDGGE